MRPRSNGKTPGTRSNALWGSGRSGSDTRASALWGKGGRNLVALFALALALVVPGSGIAGGSPANGKAAALVPGALLAQAQANPDQVFHVIVQGTKGKRSRTV